MPHVNNKITRKTYMNSQEKELINYSYHYT